ncbi:uncharacterized protein A1O9_11842 [Exophiala aquamarina CBS 119918]|uniref:Vacuolar protein sorting-associated protein 62 n=1 Tax=Exophiala aquamarina CBS 119918 TaxID=1182545 RepID=A0A072P9H3_9EURO|nr:uncharacterized protein A1O9_11842 [Exophiala aquamarina CBS 119918]KEF52215.1 hypothetical protein A1O9_11842 [Exophiala aquamarina CBS 119918]
MSLNSIYRATNPEAFIWQDEDREEATWMATSKSWFDRKACRWLGVCGGMHMHLIKESDTFGHIPQMTRKQHRKTDTTPDWDWQNAWTEGKDRPEDWTDDERVLRDIPDYVLEYAPLVHLYSGEQFWPCDIAEHLYHITPALNYTPLQSEDKHPTLKNLEKLNKWQEGRWVFLTSDDDVEERPEWLEGEKNIPNAPTNPDEQFLDNDGWVHRPGRTYWQGVKDWFAPELDDTTVEKDVRTTHFGKTDNSRAIAKVHEQLKRSPSAGDNGGKLRGGRSDAPAVLITVNKGHGIVDAFWFFFYSFNLGNVVLNVRFGNHVGDWEHTAIRFQHGEPKAVFFSEHNFGSAYSYDAVEKLGKRPVIYSAYGTHAMYSTPATHPYILPWGILHDLTDRGPLWDPALNAHAYTYDHKNDTLRSSNLTPEAPTEWFNFAGHWGDKFYPLNDRRQYRFVGQYHYVNGPLGPKFKNLGRKKICPGSDTTPCVIKNWLSGSDKIGRVHLSNVDGEDL